MLEISEKHQALRFGQVKATGKNFDISYGKNNNTAIFSEQQSTTAVRWLDAAIIQTATKLGENWLNQTEANGNGDISSEASEEQIQTNGIVVVAQNETETDRISDLLLENDFPVDSLYHFGVREDGKENHDGLTSLHLFDGLASEVSHAFADAFIVELYDKISVLRHHEVRNQSILYEALLYYMALVKFTQSNPPSLREVVQVLSAPSVFEAKREEFLYEAPQDDIDAKDKAFRKEALRYWGKHSFEDMLPVAKRFVLNCLSNLMSLPEVGNVFFTESSFTFGGFCQEGGVALFNAGTPILGSDDASLLGKLFRARYNFSRRIPNKERSQSRQLLVLEDYNKLFLQDEPRFFATSQRHETMVFLLSDSISELKESHGQVEIKRLLDSIDNEFMSGSQFNREAEKYMESMEQMKAFKKEATLGEHELFGRYHYGYFQKLPQFTTLEPLPNFELKALKEKLAVKKAEASVIPVRDEEDKSKENIKKSQAEYHDTSTIFGNPLSLAQEAETIEEKVETKAENESLGLNSEDTERDKQEEKEE